MVTLYALVFVVVAGNHNLFGHVKYNIPFESMAACHEFVDSGAVDADAEKLLKRLEADFPYKELALDFECEPPPREHKA